MKIILTGPSGNLAYWNAFTRTIGQHAFGFQGRFRHDLECSFARLSAFAGNSNHAPKGHDGAITSDFGLDLLHALAGVK